MAQPVFQFKVMSKDSSSEMSQGSEPCRLCMFRLQPCQFSLFQKKRGESSAGVQLRQVQPNSGQFRPKECIPLCFQVCFQVTSGAKPGWIGSGQNRLVQHSTDIP